MVVRFVRSRMVTVIDPDTQIGAGLEQFVILTRVTFRYRDGGRRQATTGSADERMWRVD